VQGTSSLVVPGWFASESGLVTVGGGGGGGGSGSGLLGLTSLTFSGGISNCNAPKKMEET
jgi:hypothetical protein